MSSSRDRSAEVQMLGRGLCSPHCFALPTQASARRSSVTSLYTPHPNTELFPSLKEPITFSVQPHPFQAVCRSRRVGAGRDLQATCEGLRWAQRACALIPFPYHQPLPGEPGCLEEMGSPQCLSPSGLQGSRRAGWAWGDPEISQLSQQAWLHLGSLPRALV